MTIYGTIKAAISVKQAAEHYGLKVNRNGMACCPFHNDRHPSLKLNEDYFFCFGCGAKGDVIDLVARLFNACELNAQLYAPSAPLALQSLIFKIWKTIFDNTAHEKNDTSPVSLQLSILKDMLSYVHEHYPEKISLNDIANAGKISISSCNTIYKKYLKESPIKHLLNYRLMKSCELLIENALSVTEIAFDVGFANTSYYIDTFKKRYGCTPNEYRKRNKLSEIFTPNTDSFL